MVQDEENSESGFLHKPVNEIDMSIDETLPKRPPGSGDENNSKKTDLESNEVNKGSDEQSEQQPLTAKRKAKESNFKNNNSWIRSNQIKELLFLLWDGVGVFDTEHYRLKRTHGVAFYSWFDKLFSLKWVFFTLLGAALTVLFIILEVQKVGTIKSQVNYDQPKQQFTFNLTDSFSAHFLTVFRPNEVNDWIRSKDSAFSPVSDLVESNLY